MERLPGGVFVIDPKREELLVKEANRLKIPVLALTDTNCDPEVIDYVIPGNDDAIRSISLISRLVADAIIAGRGEEVQVEQRPVAPVIEDSQLNGEVEQTGAAADPTEAPNGVPEGPRADEPEATPEPEAAPEADTADGSEIEAEPEATTQAESEPEAVEAEAIDAEVVEPEAAAEPQAELPETQPSEQSGPVEEEAPDEENEETEEK